MKLVYSEKQIQRFGTGPHLDLEISFYSVYSLHILYSTKFLKTNSLLEVIQKILKSFLNYLVSKKM